MSVPPVLYKYVTARVAKLVLTSRMIRFTQPGVMNDLYECKPEIVGLLPKGHFVERGAREIGAYLGWLRGRELGNPLTMVDFSVFRERERKLIDSTFDTVMIEKNRELPDDVAAFFNERIGILCLTDCRDQQAMWAHYADLNQGVVIGLDTSHGFFDTRDGPADMFRHLRRVEYTDSVPALTYQELMASADFMYLKTNDWEYEREWRLIRPLSRAEKREEDPDRPGFPRYYYRIPEQCFLEVILGRRMSEKDRAEIVAVLAAGDLKRTTLVNL